MHPHGYIDQQPGDLRLTVFGGDFDYSTLTAFASEARCVPGFPGLKVEATVIGASHIVSFTGPFMFHELFACVEPPGLSGKELDACLDRTFRYEAGRYRYTFRAGYAAWQEPEPFVLRMFVEAARCSPTILFGIVQEFPAQEMSATPKTVVVVYFQDGSFVIETAHSYPNVRRLVLSRSTLTHIKEVS